MIVKAFRWFLVVLSVVAYKGLLAEYLAPHGIGLRYALLVVLFAGLSYGTTRGILVGGVVGFITDCLTPSFLGWGMLVMASVGAAAGMARERLFLDRIYSRWLAFAAGVALHDIVYLFPVSDFDVMNYLRTLWRTTGISVLVTSIVGVAALTIWQTIKKTDQSQSGTKAEKAASV